MKQVRKKNFTGWLAIAAGMGVAVGIVTGVWRGTLVERALMPVVLAGQSMPTVARITRTAVIEELSKDYVRSIRA